jgi:hypothetical protein
MDRKYHYDYFYESPAGTRAEQQPKKYGRCPEESICRFHELNHQALGGVRQLAGPLRSGTGCEKPFLAAFRPNIYYDECEKKLLLHDPTT